MARRSRGPWAPNKTANRAKVKSLVNKSITTFLYTFYTKKLQSSFVCFLVHTSLRNTCGCGSWRIPWLTPARRDLRCLNALPRAALLGQATWWARAGFDPSPGGGRIKPWYRTYVDRQVTYSWTLGAKFLAFSPALCVSSDFIGA